MTTNKETALQTSEQLGMIANINKSVIDNAVREIKARHANVSNLETPKQFIKKKLGNDYVQFPYMRKQADTFYPGWSWEIVSYKIQTDLAGTPEFILVHGRLKWYESGLWRSGDMVAAHRIQKKTGSQTALVDAGNDIKSSNTDCMKKAMNVFMNIADDIYKAQAEDPDLSDEQREEVLVKARILDREKEFEDMIDDGSIFAQQLKGTHAKLDRLIRDKEKKDNATI